VGHGGIDPLNLISVQWRKPRIRYREKSRLSLAQAEESVQQLLACLHGKVQR